MSCNHFSMCISFQVNAGLYGPSATAMGLNIAITKRDHMLQQPPWRAKASFVSAMSLFETEEQKSYKQIQTLPQTSKNWLKIQQQAHPSNMV